MEKDYTSLVDRVDSLEKKLEKGVVVAQSQSPRQGSEVTASEEIAKMELPKAIPEEVKQIIGNWKGILSQLTGITKTYLNKAVPTLDQITVYFWYLKIRMRMSTFRKIVQNVRTV